MVICAYFRSTHGWYCLPSWSKRFPCHSSCPAFFYQPPWLHGRPSCAQPFQHGMSRRKSSGTLISASNAKAVTHGLDLGSLPSMDNFASTIAVEIADGILPPLSSSTCIAYYRNLMFAVEVTEDIYKKKFQMTHFSHIALVCDSLMNFDVTASAYYLFPALRTCQARAGL